MARLAFFACERFYPDGGWKDFRGVFDDLEAIKKQIEAWDYHLFEVYQVVDLDTLELIAEGRQGNNKFLGDEIMYIRGPNILPPDIETTPMVEDKT